MTKFVNTYICITQPVLTNPKSHTKYIIAREISEEAGIILCMCPANWRPCYNVTSSLIGWAPTQNDSWEACILFIIIAPADGLAPSGARTSAGTGWPNSCPVFIWSWHFGGININVNTYNPKGCLKWIKSETKWPLCRIWHFQIYMLLAKIVVFWFNFY